MSPGYRLLVKWSRTVHVYLTLFGLALLLFFAVTGFMLNHENWFSPLEPARSTLEGPIPSELLNPLDRLGVVELLRKDFAASGALSSFETEEDSYRLVFKAPGLLVEATIQREDGLATVVRESNGLAGVMLDMHRGKSSGFVWSLVIDAVAGVFVVVSVTGIVLWSSLRSRARYGLAVIVTGLAVGLVLYLAYVPR